MKDDSSLINLDFLILLLIIIIVALFIVKYFMPDLSDQKSSLQRKRYRSNLQSDSELIEDYGNLPDDIINEITNSNYQLISNNDATKIINKSDEDTLTELSNNYNNMNV